MSKHSWTKTSQALPLEGRACWITIPEDGRVALAYRTHDTDIDVGWSSGYPLELHHEWWGDDEVTSWMYASIPEYPGEE